MEEQLHVCQHTEDGEEACDSCYYLHSPRVVTKQTATRVASIRNTTNRHNRTPRLLKTAIRANRAERDKSLRASLNAGRNWHSVRYGFVYGPQHLSFL